MELRDIDGQTEDTFYRCLHDEQPADPRVMAMRRAWRAEYQPKGHRAKVLIDDAGEVVGLTNYIPVEHSPYEGENLMAILCMWIHGYDHLVGNQQAKGYGRFMLGEIEADARRSGCDGMVVWGKDYDAWNPVSFYEHMGYRRVAQEGLDVLAWKPFNDRAVRPRFLEKNARWNGEADDGRVELISFSNGWCGGGCQQCVMARDAAAGLEDRVNLIEVYAHRKADMRRRGESIDVLYVDGEAFRPDGPPSSTETLRQHLLARYERRSG
ncbi:MAG: N-acetyltransferase family protein [Pseudomonadales bacterium]